MGTHSGRYISLPFLFTFIPTILPVLVAQAQLATAAESAIVAVAVPWAGATLFILDVHKK